MCFTYALDDCYEFFSASLTTESALLRQHDSFSVLGTFTVHDGLGEFKCFCSEALRRPAICAQTAYA